MAGLWREKLISWLHEPALYLAAAPGSRWRQAEALSALDDRLLRDIGISRTEAQIGRPTNPLGPGNWPLSGPGKATGFGRVSG